MDIAALNAFLAVAETGSFSLAAQKLYLTQPAISKRIAALESSLGAKVFDRIGHKITLTEAGRTLQPNASLILRAMQESRVAIANLENTVSGPLLMATSHHIGLRRLPPVLREYTRRYPNVQLNIHFMTSESGWAAVENGELELAVVTLPESQAPKLHTVSIWDDPLVVAINREHALDKSSSVSIEQLAQYPAVLPETGSFTRSIIEQAFTDRELELNITLETHYLETIMMMVSVGLGWSILPYKMLSSDIKALDVPELKLHRSLGIVKHHNRTLSNAGYQLINLLEQEKNKVPANRT